jgi:hypothetical protein
MRIRTGRGIEAMGPENNPADDAQPTKEEWEAYEALRDEPTERPFTGEPIEPEEVGRLVVGEEMP